MLKGKRGKKGQQQRRKEEKEWEEKNIKERLYGKKNKAKERGKIRKKEKE